MEQDLQTRDELLSLAESSAGIGVWVADLATSTLVATPQFFRLLGIDPVAGPVSQDFPRQFRHPEDRERVTRDFLAALERGEDLYEVEYRIIRPSGEIRWIFGRGRITRDSAGRAWRYSGVDIDITDRKKQEEHLRTVMGELLHRTNNLLAVVQAMARQTARGTQSIKDFAPTFGARLQGLGESSALLARQEWHGARLDDLLRAQAAPFAEGHRFALEGPPVLLTPRAVQNLGLAFHELCTNATKYGALASPKGRVSVKWSVSPEGLHLVWKEHDGPPVAPPRRAGFGRVVSDQMLTAALEARVQTDYAADGLAWTLDVPATELLRDAG